MTRRGRAGWFGHIRVTRGGLRLTWVVADQCLVSAANLATTVMLARALSAEEFGLYALFLAAFFLAANVQAGLITRPHNVLGATRRGDAYRTYTTSTAVGQLIFTSASASVVLLIALVASARESSTAQLLFAFVPFVIATQMQEFGRRVLYTEGRFAAAVGNDALSYGGQVVGVAILATGGGLSTTTALLVMAGAFATGAAALVAQLRSSFATRPRTVELSENWKHGKWLAAAEGVHWLGGGAYFYLAAAVLGAPAAAALKVAQVFFGPLRVLLQFLYGVAPRGFARAYADGGAPALRMRVRQTYMLVIPVLIAYCLPVAVFSAPLLQLVYGDKYSFAAGVVALMAIQYFVGLIVPVVTSLLQVEDLARDVFLSRSFATIVSLPLGLALIVSLGVEGAVLGMTASALLITLYSWYAHRRHAQTGAEPARSVA